MVANPQRYACANDCIFKIYSNSRKQTETDGHHLGFVGVSRADFD